MKKVLAVMLNPSVDNMIEFDDFIIYKTNRATDEHACMGGKGLNVSSVVRSFDIDTTLTGFIGKDKADELASVLENADIHNEFVTVSGNTRENLKLLNKKNMKVTEVNGISFTVSDDEMKQLEEKLDNLFENVDIIVITGSLPGGVNADYYAKLVKKANALGKKTILDASGAALKAAISEKPYAIKPNIDELGELLNEKLDNIQDIAMKTEKLLSDGISLIAVSMGADGAVFADRENCIFGENLDIEVKSAVGAGDSVVAAMVYAIAENKSLDEIAKLGIAAGNMTTAKTGTDLCVASEIQAVKDAVNISYIK